MLTINFYSATFNVIRISAYFNKHNEIRLRNTELTEPIHSMPPFKLYTKEHKNIGRVFEVVDFSDLLSPPPIGKTLINFDFLKVGNVVKICVGMEQFWCIITQVKGEFITASVANDLFQVPLYIGMKLRFHWNCIYAVEDVLQTNEPYLQMENMRLIQANVTP
jgi:hypothetical protein